MSSERVQVSDAVAGDIVGLYDTGNFRLVIQSMLGRRKLSIQSYHNLRLKFLCE